jgi:flagellar hook-length control protein FliK
VRASATSRTVSHASPQAAQAKSNANQASDASPFGQLLAATAPKQADGSSRKDQKDTSDSGDRQADNTASAEQDNSSGASQAAASTSPRPKTDKTDKRDDQAAAKAKSDTADDSQNATLDQQLVQLQAAPAPANSADDDGLQLDKLASAVPAAAPTDTAVPDPAASKPSDAAAAQAASAQQAAQADDFELQAAQTLAAQAGSEAAISGDLAAQSGATAIAANDGQNNAKSDAAQAGKAAKVAAPDEKSAGDSILGAIAQQANAGAATKAGMAKSDIAKDDTGKTGNAKIRGSQNGVASDVARDIVSDKPDTGSSDATAQSRTGSAQAILDSLQAPAKSAPPVQAANADFDISGLTLPPGLTAARGQQDIQVSAKPAPNLPALAVEIAARSQSGARQFDIRLDPPELGRVDVRLSIDATGKASAHLSADQPHTLTLLQNDAPALTRALREAGLDVSQNGLNFSLRQQAENNSGNAGDNGRRGTSRAFSLTATADIDTTALTAAYRGIGHGRLDIRV